MSSPSPSPPSADDARGGGGRSPASFSPSKKKHGNKKRGRRPSSSTLINVARTHPLPSAVALALVGMWLALLLVSHRVVMDEEQWGNDGKPLGLGPPPPPKKGRESGEGGFTDGGSTGTGTTSKATEGGGSHGGRVPEGKGGGDEMSNAIASPSGGGSSRPVGGGEGAVPVPRREEETSPHRHVIPNIVTFTHYVDLLNHTTDVEFSDPEDAVLAANVRNTLSLHPGAEVHFLTDTLCIDAIRTALAPSSTTTAEKLVKYFKKEKKGMYKADICRGAALYNTGGLYFDVDIQARMNVFSVLPTHVEFVTPKVHSKSKVVGSFFQAFIGVTPHHPIMRRYLEMFVEYYEGEREVKGALGVVLLRKAYDDTPSLTKDNSALWQEVRYDPKYFPDVEPTKGKRRACHFLVAIPHTHTAVFYSRVRGSRMCGGRHSNLRGNEDIDA